jgi:hypothetical protein
MEPDEIPPDEPGSPVTVPPPGGDAATPPAFEPEGSALQGGHSKSGLSPTASPAPANRSAEPLPEPETESVGDPEGDSRLDRLVDVVAGALVAVFAFGIPLPEQGLSLRVLVFPIVSWLVFALQVGLLWNLHREARSAGRRGPIAVLFHLPFLASMLLLTIPARRILLLHELWAGPARRGEFLDALSWYAVLLGIGVASVGAMIATAQRGEAEAERPALSALRSSRLRICFGSALFAFVTAGLLPRLGGLAILPWGLFPSWVLVERSRLVSRFPELAKRLA